MRKKQQKNAFKIIRLIVKVTINIVSYQDILLFTIHAMDSIGWGPLETWMPS
jgi:hypothetical protein